MRKFTLVVAGGLISALSFGQISWSDNFDSYTVGDYVGVAGADKGWTTWSGTTGGAEDVQVTDADANSGSNSVYFEGEEPSGPHDVVLDFGDVYSEGSFHASVAVKADSGYYFNFQAGAGIGDAWALDLQADDSTLFVYNYDGANFIIHAAHDIAGGANDWHTIELDVDFELDSNNWTVTYDGVEIANFTNTEASSVSMMDFYPLGGEYDWYMDDVMWSHTPAAKNVTFQVDMNYFPGTIGSMAVAGNYVNNWCGTCNPMADDDGDGIYTATVSIAADSIEWKYLMDDWATSEQFTEGMACTKTTAGFTNRFVHLTGDVVLDPVCWEQCDTCSVPAGVAEMASNTTLVYPNPSNDVINVEFAKEMKNVTLSVYDLTGREVARPFNAFNGTKAVFNVNTLPQGVYTLIGSNEDFRFTQSIVITK